MTTQSFADMLASAKKGAGLIAAGPVTLQCISALHGVSKNGGDPQIVGSFKLVGGQFNGRTMKAWFTLKSDTPASVLGFFEDMAAFGIPEAELSAMGSPNDVVLAALAARMVNKVVGADVYHQPDNRNPGKKSAWLQNFRVHNGPVPQGVGGAPAPAPAPAAAPAPQQGGQPPVYAPQQQVQAPVYQQAPNGQQPGAYAQPQAPQQYAPQQPVPGQPGYGYPQPSAGAPATHTGAPAQHSGAVYQPQAPAAPAAPVPPAEQPVQGVTPVPGQVAYTEEPPF